MSSDLAKNILVGAVPYTGPRVSVEDFARKNGCLFQATVVGTGAVTSTVILEGSIDGVNYVLLDTLSLTGTTTHTLGSAKQPWPYIRTRITAITGTSAAVTVSAIYY